ncbi:MAG: hypothetical protein EBY95_05905, partial [Actinobacteria bacterium]|nr:hypothetical protein [Actinomycetota bacterium]
AIGMDALHLSSVVLWFGGLFVLTTGSVLASPHATHVVARFSRMATWAIPIAVVTGLWQTWHLVPRLSDITDTDWGKGLLIKGCFVVGVVTLVLLVGSSAAVARRTVVAPRPSVAPRAAGSTGAA